MEVTEIKLEYEVCGEENGGIPVIIVAAGMSSRMGGTDKQTALIGGVPVIARTLMAFERSRAVSEIILVVRPDELFNMQLTAERYSVTKLTDIVCGGNSRQESVLKGFERLGKSAGKVLIHDGARPLVSGRIIESVAAALREYPAVTCAVKVKDTIKETDGSGNVVSTPDRSRLAAVQTPQGVWVKEYLAAAQKAGDVSAFTDDMSVMESEGFPVRTVEGSYTNIKITTPEDLRLAEFLLGEESGE